MLPIFTVFRAQLISAGVWEAAAQWCFYDWIRE